MQLIGILCSGVLSIAQVLIEALLNYDHLKEWASLNDCYTKV
jgi:hypothetical protein